jgi:hypothetical protein
MKERSLTAKIKRVINTQDEKKYAGSSNPALQDSGAMTPIIFTSNISGVGEIYNLIPPISQGTDTNDRIGQRIRPTALRVKLTFSMLGENANATSILVRCMILTSKAVKDPDNYTAVPITLLLDPGNGEGGLVDFGGYLQDHQLPIANEHFTVLHDYKFQMGKGINTVNGSGGSVTNQIRDAFTQRSFTIKCPAFNYAGAGTQPNNFFPFMVCGYSYTDGTAPDKVSGILGVTIRKELYYTDA